ncbi:FAD/NAD-P-binding domain-containing protein [Mycena galericulata]|nr:FAD/NAD-P-binding domain-containing protein [Mycena galericulata]KAJ7478711.1 FAD/NAD-P-binding domain-containing protein [Mycena galericulata]
MVFLNSQAILLALSITTVIGRQVVFEASNDSSQWTTFPRPITRVAVIGAGPAGLQAAAHLLAANLTVRLFERAPSPGGNWFYTEEIPMRESYPNNTFERKQPVPDVLRATIYYREGDDGISLKGRWKEHWQPRPVWYDLHTNTPATITALPGLVYPANTPWSVSVHDVQRLVRGYASLNGLNANDNPISPSAAPVASYSTRVESIRKDNATSMWTLGLRHLEWLGGSDRVIKADFWTEDFDAVVVAVGSYTTPYVPAIPGIANWSKAVEEGHYNMYHSHAFRHPERFAGKMVLIVGGSISATEIARSIAPFTKRLLASVRPNRYRDGYGLDLLLKFPAKAEIVPEISSFDPLSSDAAGIRAGVIRLANGSELSGIDEVILATGYRRNTFLPDLVDSRLSNVYWTGHYIQDPTLAYASVPRPWTHGRYQSYAFAKVWTGKARLPSRERMLQDYQARRYEFGGALDVLPQEALARQYVTWLNNESLEFGGHLVDPLPVEARESVAYFVNAHWKQNWGTNENYTRFDELPSSEWPRPGSEAFKGEIASW